MDPDSTRARAGAVGGDDDPLLNMAATDRHEPGQRQARVFCGFRWPELRSLGGTCNPDEAVVEPAGDPALPCGGNLPAPIDMGVEGGP